MDSIDGTGGIPDRSNSAVDSTNPNCLTYVSMAADIAQAKGLYGNKPIFTVGSEGGSRRDACWRICSLSMAAGDPSVML